MLRIPPGRLRAALIRAQNLAGIGMINAEGVADRLGVSATDIDTVLRVLAAVGLADMRTASGGRRVYATHQLTAHVPPEGRRPELTILPREVLAVLGRLALETPASTDSIAAGLTAAAGPVDPVWLTLQLALFVAAGTLGVHHDGRWHLSPFGAAAASRARTQPLHTEEIAAACAAEQLRLSGSFDRATIAARLGVPVALVNLWLIDAVDAGHAVHRGNRTVLTDAGRERLRTASPLQRRSATSPR